MRGARISDIYYTGKWKIAYNFQSNKRKENKNIKNRHVKYCVIGKTLSNIEVKYVYNLCYIFIFPNIHFSILGRMTFWLGMFCLYYILSKSVYICIYDMFYFLYGFFLFGDIYDGIL